MQDVNDSSSQWITFGASVIGSSHVKQNKPCQDSHYISMIDDYWGIAIVSDGAGSAKLSQKGSKYITSEVGKRILTRELKLKEWFNKRVPPRKKQWQLYSIDLVYEIRKLLWIYSKKKNIAIKDLSSTFILVVFSRDCLLRINVGDGRATFRNEKGEWLALMKPFRGEEANSTVFITTFMTNKEKTISSAKIEDYIFSDVISEKITAFAILSDGVENSSFECSKMGNKEDQWTDPNLPYKPFFEPIYDHVYSNKDNVFFLSENNKRLEKFLVNGNNNLIEETDDKTLIFGISK